MSNVCVYDYWEINQKGEYISLAAYRGTVLLIVNTSIKSRFTSQYAGLQKLYAKYAEKGLVILDFPCNQFSKQVPEHDAEITRICSEKYGVTFPQFRTIEVEGKKEDPLYTYLKSRKGGRIKKDFTKFLVDREGRVIARFEPRKAPEAMEPDIVRLL